MYISTRACDYRGSPASQSAAPQRLHNVHDVTGRDPGARLCARVYGIFMNIRAGFNDSQVKLRKVAPMYHELVIRFVACIFTNHPSSPAGGAPDRKRAPCASIHVRIFLSATMAPRSSPM